MARNYAKWSAEAAALEEQQAREEGGGGAGYLKLKSGRNVLRILPPRVGESSPFHRVWQHYIQGPDGKWVVFKCPHRGLPKGEAQPCPACEEAERLDASGNPLDKEQARKLWPSRRVYANAVDRSDPDGGVKVLVVGKMIYEGLLNIAKDPDAGGDFTDPEGGFDVIITKTGEKLDTRYKVTAARSNSPLSEDEDEMDDWLDDMHDLPTTVRAMTYDEIKAAALGEEAPPPRRQIEDDREPSRNRSRRSRRRAEDDATDADWDE